MTALLTGWSKPFLFLNDVDLHELIWLILLRLITFHAVHYLFLDDGIVVGAPGDFSDLYGAKLTPFDLKGLRVCYDGLGWRAETRCHW